MRLFHCRVLLSLIVPLWLACAPALAAEPATVRVGVLQYGTVSWELEVIRLSGLAEREGIRMIVVPLALNDAANVALQGNAVDVIVNDWIWVSRQRTEGRDFVFSPYSRAVGGVMVRPDAGVNTLAELRGKALGIAGGPVDKSWLLLRAYARRILGEDAANLVTPNFAAPPLLNALMLRGDLPAVLNFWHFNARLHAAGMRELLSLDEILTELGIREPLPMIGWVFRADWATSNREAIDGFLRASLAAKALMRDSDEIWDTLRPMMRVDDDATHQALRDGFRAGIPDPDDRFEAIARQVFEILADEGGRELVGSARTLAPGTFWDWSEAR